MLHGNNINVKTKSGLFWANSDDLRLAAYCAWTCRNAYGRKGSRVEGEAVGGGRTLFNSPA